MNAKQNSRRAVLESVFSFSPDTSRRQFGAHRAFFLSHQTGQAK